MEFKRRKYNTYIEHENYYEVILTDKNNNIICSALIDKEDKNKCEKLQWRINRCGTNTSYVIAHQKDKNNNDKAIPMHRYIMNYFGQLQIDHINRDGLDNRKENLRIVECSTNNLNKKTKGTKKVGNNFAAKFQAAGKLYLLGYYSSEQDASNVVEIAKQKFINNKDSFMQEYNLIKQLDLLPNPNRNIVKTPCGNFAVKYLYKKQTIYIGTRNTLQEAQDLRDAFEHKRDSYIHGKYAFYEKFLA